MRSPIAIGVFIFSLCTLTGCATTIQTSSPSTPPVTDDLSFSSLEHYAPSETAIRSHIHKKINRSVTVLISDHDFGLTHDVHMGLVGYITPYRVYPGRTLKAHAELYLMQLFDKVSFDVQGYSDIYIDLDIRSFDITAVNKAAHLKVGINIMNNNMKSILAKDYSGDGDGHVPLYLADIQQEQQVAKTTNQAFEQVFVQIVNDIQMDLKFE